MTCPRLIEVALPIREISAESVRDKSLRHGHISTLHLWWARRPLSASRAIVFASLVPDPDHPDCPQDFKDTVYRFLGKGNVPRILQQYRRGRHDFESTDPYKPYEGMEDTLRNRLLTFIARWSPEWIQFEAGRSDKQPGPSEMLDDRCLVKWETSDPQNEQGKVILHIAKELIRIANGGETPTVLDPFSGGGSIPLEAGRLGCNTIANDYNPVAYLILRATCEYPQKYGKPGRRNGPNGEESEVPNVLAFDVDYWAKRVQEIAKVQINEFYPVGMDGNPIVGYLWARTVLCANPNCKAEIPLLRSLTICEKTNKKYTLTMQLDRNNKSVKFGVVHNDVTAETTGTMLSGGNCNCPFCEQITSVQHIRQSGLDGKIGEVMLAVVTDTPDGKSYRTVEKLDLEAYQKAKLVYADIEKPTEFIVPEINSPQADIDAGAHRSISVDMYGYKTFASLFNPRQLVCMSAFVIAINQVETELLAQVNDSEYRKCIMLYLGVLLSRISQRMSNIGIWNTGGEKFEHPFGRQSLAMVWDYPEVNPFSDSTGGTDGQLGWIQRVIAHEQVQGTISNSISVRQGDAASINGSVKPVQTIITDPPYFDAIAYADLSDYFYVWLKRVLNNSFPSAFITPQTPKIDEAVAHKHRHHGKKELGKKHFSKKLAESFATAKKHCRQDGTVSIMFAHQSTEAWTALIDAIFSAGLNITATYPIDTERVLALKKDISALASSITVVCRHREFGNAITFRDVRALIEKEVAKAVNRFWNYGFRGADLIVACFGPAVGVFGQFERVERADGTLVGVKELLDFVRECALKAIAGEFNGDHLSRLYFVWVNLYGTSVQKFNDARLVIQIGGGDDINIDIAKQEKLFIVDGSDCRLALLADRTDISKLGREPESPLIDRLHFAMRLWQAELRNDLIGYLRSNDLLEDERFWKLAQALFEVLPRTEVDWKLVSALLSERDTLKLESRKKLPTEPEIGQSRSLDLPAEE